MKEENQMVVKRRFERIYKMMECKSYMKNKDIPENKELFVYGFKHIKSDKIDIYIAVGWESDKTYGNDKLFNFWCNKFINKEREMRNFKSTGWSFMTLFKRNNFFEIQGICL